MYAFHLSSVPPARSHYCSTPPPTSKLCLGSLQCRRTRPRQGSSAIQTTRLGAAEVSPHLGVIILIRVTKLSTPHLRRRRPRLIGLIFILPVRRLSTSLTNHLHPFPSSSTQTAPCVKVCKERKKQIKAFVSQLTLIPSLKLITDIFSACSMAEPNLPLFHWRTLVCLHLPR